MIDPRLGPLDHALRYARAGWSVFPCRLDTRGAKRPMIDRWQLVASTDPDQLAAWWGDAPGAMVGLAHRLTGTLALDIDAKPDASAALRLAMILEEDPARWLPYGPAFRSKSGGAQYIMQRPDDLADLSGNYTKVFGVGSDLILGYSVLPSGTATPGRRWLFGTDADPAPPAPGWIADMARARRDASAAIAVLPVEVRPMPIPATPADALSLRYVSAAIDGEAAAIRALPSGERQVGLHRAACNVGRALGRASRWDLAGWAADTLATAAAWCQTRHERATIDRGIAWGLEHHGERS